MPIRSGYILSAVTLAVLLAGLLSLLLPERSYACSQPLPRSPLQAMDISHSVFRGKVISAVHLDREPGHEETRYEFMVSAVWKGPLTESRTITSRDYEPACGRRFWVDEEYLVYSHDGYRDAFGTRTRLISEAAEDLAELGEGDTPIPGTVLPISSADEENGGGCGIAPNTVDLSIVGILVGIACMGLGRRRSHTP